MGNETEGDIGDYFRSNLLTVRKAISQQEFKRFATLDRNADKVAFILSYPEAHHLSLEVENAGCKDSEKALRLKDAGNKFFGHGEFRKSLESYSNAALLAPQNDLGVILANRSATLYHLQRHQEALQDIEEALRVGYPKELLYKLEERRARCHLALKNHDRAMESFKTALKCLDDTKLPMERKGKLEADIRVMLAVMDKGKTMREAAKDSRRITKKENGKSNIPQIKERNPLYPACSKAVQIVNDGGNVGRHAIATRNILPGETLVVERPYCALLLAEYRLTHCHLCFSRIFVPVPAACNTCNCVAYCSVSCRDADTKVHLRECNLLPALWLSKASVTCFLALRAIVQKSFEELIDNKEKLQYIDDNFEVTAEKPYKGNSYEAFYHLVTHEKERSTEDIFHRAYIASWLLRLLKTSTYFPENVRTPDDATQNLSDGELFVAELLLHNLQLLQFNSHEVSELIRSRDDRSLAKAKSIFIGGGVYPTVALFNHSCNPGVVRYFVGTTMIVRAIRTIPAGEEISENYGPIFTTTNEVERKRKMRVQYWFDCKCEACMGHWPLLEDMNSTILRFKCATRSSCNNILPIETATNEFIVNCAKCGNNTNILKGLKALQDTDTLFKVASKNFEEGQHDKALKSYLEILKLLDETLALPIKDYHLCQQGVRLCMLTLGNIAVV